MSVVLWYLKKNRRSLENLYQTLPLAFHLISRHIGVGLKKPRLRFAFLTHTSDETLSVVFDMLLQNALTYWGHIRSAILKW